MKRFWLLLVLASAFVLSANGVKPKYVFLFIGDGMSTPQRMVAEEFSRKTGRGNLLINSLPYHATTRTRSSNSLVTDSAAAATAIACGVKTVNGYLGVDAEKNPVGSVAELARDNGKKIGIVTTVFLNHATPGGFYAHRHSRNQYYEIGLDLIASKFDFFGGGGIYKHSDGGENIFELAKKAGYRVVHGWELNELTPGEKAIAVVDRDGTYMPYAIDDLEGKLPSLADVTRKAISLLDNENGFFMMVEGGSIDVAGHANDGAANLYEVLAFDDAVKVAMNFYEKHPEETLIVVTGDHETGGMTMGFSGTGYNMYPERLANQKISISSFGAMMSKLRKDNPQMQFEEAKPILVEKFGFVFSGNTKDPMYINEKEMKQLASGFEKGRFPNAVRSVINGKAGIGWTSGAHTAVPVLTTSIGSRAELFTGFIENTEISERLRKIL